MLEVAGITATLLTPLYLLVYSLKTDVAEVKKNVAVNDERIQAVRDPYVPAGAGSGEGSYRAEA